MVEPFKHDTLRQFKCFHDQKDIIAGITTRQGGHSEAPFQSLNMGLHVPDEEAKVINNREELASELGIPLDRWVMGEQVHGTKIKVIETKDLGKGAFSHSTSLSGVDGLITNQPDVLLTAFYADCVPLLFSDKTAGWVGIAHAGWKGTVRLMAAEMVKQMVEKGCSVENIQMTIGPCIGKAHYEVDERVFEAVPARFQSDTTTKTSLGKYLLDLKHLNRCIAQEAGIKDVNLFTSEYCTYEKDELFFSHRRDQGLTGRMLGYIGLKS